MKNIRLINHSDTFKKHCEFIKKNMSCNTYTGAIKEAVRIAYLKLKEDKKEELERQLKDLEK